MNTTEDIPFVYFGTPHFSTSVLDQMESTGLLPELIVTAPDRKRGRGQKKQPTAVRAWAQKRSLPVLTPDSIDENFINDLERRASEDGWSVFVVVAYGKILPADLIYLPEHNTLNLHPSLLPKMRGAAPIRGSILHEDNAGVTVIELDEEMDHGPIITQEVVSAEPWPPRYDELKPRLAQAGGQLLAGTIPEWINHEITATPQDHDQATYISKFASDDGEVDFTDNPETNLRKIRAFTNWPKAHFYTNNNTRVIITAAHIEDGELVIDSVKPAGSEEMSYGTFQEKVA